MRHLLSALAIAAATSTLAAQPPRAAQYYNPAWSPDGRSLAFESDRDGKFAIYVVSVDGGGLRQLAEGAQPGWSPDGRRLVFTSNRDGHGQLYLMNADGSNQTRLTNTPDRNDFFASFSPNSQWILLGAQDIHKRENYYVAVVAVDGSGRRELTDSTSVSEGPRWTTDGARIVFTRLPKLERKPGEAIRDLLARRDAGKATVSVRPDGSDQRVGREAEADGKRVRDPAVSPDARWIAEGKTVGGVPGIYVREIATGRERLVTER